MLKKIIFRSFLVTAGILDRRHKTQALPQSYLVLIGFREDLNVKSVLIKDGTQ